MYGSHFTLKLQSFKFGQFIYKPLNLSGEMEKETEIENNIYQLNVTSAD